MIVPHEGVRAVDPVVTQACSLMAADHCKSFNYSFHSNHYNHGIIHSLMHLMLLWGGVEVVSDTSTHSFIPNIVQVLSCQEKKSFQITEVSVSNLSHTMLARFCFLYCMGRTSCSLHILLYTRERLFFQFIFNSENNFSRKWTGGSVGEPDGGSPARHQPTQQCEPANQTAAPVCPGEAAEDWPTVPTGRSAGCWATHSADSIVEACFCLAVFRSYLCWMLPAPILIQKMVLDEGGKGGNGGG